MQGNVRGEYVKQENAKRETKRKIVDAFWELYKVTNIEKITVKKITDACGIYRTTFYLHFADVYAILEEIEAHLMRDMKSIAVDVAENQEDKSRLMHDVQTSLVKYYEYLRVLLDGTHHPEFARTYKKELVKRMSMAYDIELPSMNVCDQKIVEITFSTVIDMFLGLVEELDLSCERVTDILSGYMRDGVINTIKDLAKK